MSDKFLQEKVNTSEFKKILEQENPQMQSKFVDTIKSNKLVSIVDDIKDIEISIFKSLREIEKNEKVIGWVSAKSMPDISVISKVHSENTRLKNRIQKLSSEILVLKEKNVTKQSNNKETIYNGFSFEEVLEALRSEIDIPEHLQNETGNKSLSIVRLFFGYQKTFAAGSINNASGMTDKNKFLFWTLSYYLLKFDLVTKRRVVGQKYEEIEITKNGFRFLAIYERDYHPKKKIKTNK